MDLSALPRKAWIEAAKDEEGKVGNLIALLLLLLLLLLLFNFLLCCQIFI